MSDLGDFMIHSSDLGKNKLEMEISEVMDEGKLLLVMRLITILPLEIKAGNQRYEITLSTKLNCWIFTKNS